MLRALARRHPLTKFVQSIATRCVPNYPDKNCPTLFVYLEDDLKGQIIGAHKLGSAESTLDGVERPLSQLGAEGGRAA